MTPSRVPLALVLVLVAVLLAAGCATQPASHDIPSDHITSTTTAPAVTESKGLYKITIDQSNNSHPDFIKMDSDVYNRSEVIEFYVVNEGTETLTCYSSPRTYSLYRQIQNNTWEYQTMAAQTVTDYITYFKPGESMHTRRLITSDLPLGRYRIVFDCNISREFILREMPSSQSKALYKTTLVQSNNSHPEFVKMDADTYNVGEVVEFYVVNEGPDTLTCANNPPTYRIFSQNKNGTWEHLPEVGEIMIPWISYLKPGAATPVHRFVTTGWTPGHYKIVFDCGISREFVLREMSRVTSP